MAEDIGVAELGGEFVGGAGAGAEPEGLVALKLAEGFDGPVDLGAGPFGDGEGGEGLGFDAGGIFGEALVESPGLFELFLSGLFRIQPLEPAEVGENGLADGAFFAGAEVAGVDEVLAQGGVGREIGGDGDEDAGGVVERGGVGHESGDRTRERRGWEGRKPPRFGAWGNDQ